MIRLVLVQLDEIALGPKMKERAWETKGIIDVRRARGGVRYGSGKSVHLQSRALARGG